MNAAIERFIARLGLQEFKNPRVKIISVIENSGPSKTWLNKINDKPILQLYHSSIVTGVNEDIMKNGFIVGRPDLPKGCGVYLANHSRFSAFRTPANGVFICDVIYEAKNVKRFRSVIKSPIYDSEYVVNKPALIYPRYLLEYRVDIDNTPSDFPAGYVEPGKSGCKICDKRQVRCDCPFPSYDVNDVI